MIEGLRVIVNAVYDQEPDYVDMLKRAIGGDPSTLAILIAPERPTNPWFKELEANDDFKFVGFYVKGADIFTKTGENAYDQAIRRKFKQGCTEAITVWEMRRGAANYPERSYRELAMQKEKNQVDLEPTIVA